MTKINVLRTILTGILIAFGHVVVAQTLMSTNYSIKWDVADGGGGVLLSSNYTLTDSVAQSTAIGELMSAGYTLLAGFVSIPDTDGDGYLSLVDNCTEIANPDQYDSNNDGYGNICDPDLDNNGVVNFLDAAIFGGLFLSGSGDGDFNGDGNTNFLDYAIFVTYFGELPGPSGLAP